MTESADEQALAFEAARTTQQLATATCEALAAQVRTLHTTVRDALRRAFVEELADLRRETGAATQALRQLERRTHRHLLWITPVSVMAGLTLGLAAAFWTVPPLEEIAQRRATVAALNVRGGEAQLSSCQDTHHAVRVCVRVDTHAGAFGPQHDYYLLPSPEHHP